jgi:hypothetical protein
VDTEPQMMPKEEQLIMANNILWHIQTVIRNFIPMGCILLRDVYVRNSSTNIPAIATISFYWCCYCYHITHNMFRPPGAIIRWVQYDYLVYFHLRNTITTSTDPLILLLLACLSVV